MTAAAIVSFLIILITGNYRKDFQEYNIEMVLINGGTFMMGSPESEAERWDWEGPQHQVTVDSFYIGIYPITQKQYQFIMGIYPSYFKGENLPVEQISWFDAIEYCNKLSQIYGLMPVYTVTGSEETRTVTWNKNANGYRLPTEAEWEFACRAGSTTPYNTGNNLTTNLANYNGNFPYNNNSPGIYREKTTTVDSFAPNAWGLYDKHGNVWEWCWDWYDNYTAEAKINPSGAVTGVVRVVRGGSWNDEGRWLRSAFRHGAPPGHVENNLGFRVVRNGR